MKAKINTQEVEVNIRFTHKNITMQFQQHLYIRFALRVSFSCLTYLILSYCYILSLSYFF